MSKAKVLFIDDDVMLGNIVTMALTEEGYVVHQQNSLTGIKAVVGEFRPSIIVMDVEVGAEDGIDVMPELYAVSPEIPIIVISSHSESNEVVRALQNGAVAYLKKPFETEELTIYKTSYQCDSQLHFKDKNSIAGTGYPKPYIVSGYPKIEKTK